MVRVTQIPDPHERAQRENEAHLLHRRVLYSPFVSVYIDRPRIRDKSSERRRVFGD